MANFDSRINNTLRNTLYGISGQFLSLILNFIYRTVFIYVLGASYLGIQGLFSNILSILSLAELGVGAAITFSLYKPLAEKDKKSVKALMNYYSYIYKMIGTLVAIFGVCLIPFLDFFIKDTSGIPNLTLIYILFLGEAVLSYFFSYKRSIIIADQRGYINTININVFSVFRILIQIILLLLTKNFIVTLIVQIIFTLLSNLQISRTANKMYPYLKEKPSEKINSETKNDLGKKIKAMFFHNIGSIVVVGTDNILISMFFGLQTVGIYSNYVMIIGILKNFIKQFSDSIVSSIGNMIATEETSKAYKTFNILFFFNYWIYSFCSISLLILINPFITLWIGKEYILEESLIILIILNFYLRETRQSVLAFRNVLGLYWNDRYKPLIEAIINLVASLILLRIYGVIGIFVGTLISTVTTSLWVEPYILFKHYFKISVKEYFVKYTKYLLLTTFIGLLSMYFSNLIFKGTWISLIYLSVFIFIFTNIIYIIVFSKNKEFIFICSLIKNKISKFVVPLKS